MAAGRCYTRNGVWGWSIEEQRAKLKSAGVYDAAREFCDELAASKARMPGRIQPDWLTQRKQLLRSTSGTRPGETIHVATLLALAVNEADLVAALVAASARRDTIRAADSGLEFALTEGPTVFQRAMEDWQRAKHDAQTKPGRREGNRKAAEAARSRTLEKLKIARPLWGRPTKEISTEEIRDRSGLSIKTLYTELGRRGAAQERAKRPRKKK